MGLPRGQFFGKKNPVELEATARDSSFDSGENDVALAFVGEHAQAIDADVEKRVLRKIDLFLMPAMVVGSF